MRQVVLVLVVVLAVLVVSRAQLLADDEVAEGWVVADERVVRARLSEHVYYEGQSGNFSCVRRADPQRTNVSVQFSYYSQESKSVSTTFKRQESVAWYMKLRRANNDTLLTCSIRDDSTNHTDTIQLRLLLRHKPYTQGWEVNGLQVRPEETGTGGAGSGGEVRAVRYVYRYFWEERMTVRLVRSSYYAVRCTVAGENFPPAWLDRVSEASVVAENAGVRLDNTTLLAEQSGATLRCRMRRKTVGDDPFEPDRQLELVFIYYDLVPFVGGLTMANVQLMYVADNITTLYYDQHIPYTGNDTHYLSCNPDGVSWWVWNPGELDINPDKKPDVGFPGAFRLYDHIKWSLLQCVREPHDKLPRRVVHVWLHRSDPPELSADPATPAVTSTTSTTSTSTSTTPPSTPPASSPLTPSPTPHALPTPLSSTTTYVGASEAPAEAAGWTTGVVAAGATATTLLCVACFASAAWWGCRRRAAPGGPWCVRGGSGGSGGERFSPNENIYESILEPGQSPARAGVAPDVATRPPFPLPPDVVKESARYRHYDTPYEWRIFRFGLGRRCRCGRCSAVDNK